jgi:hypothetical protein
MIYGEFGIGYHYWHEPSQTVFCAPPKCGCSAMKQALLMAGHPHLDVLFAQDTSRLHHFSHYAMVKRKSQISGAARRIFIARDPARRALSGFLSKFVLYPEAAITQAICDVGELSAEDMTFRIFVKALANVPDVYLDPHFRSQEDFLVMPLEDYEVISLDSPGRITYSQLLDGIQPGSAERYLALQQAQEASKIGPVIDQGRAIIPGRLADTPVKHLRYLRVNGSSLPAEELIFDGFEDLVRQRYELDGHINGMASTDPEDPAASPTAD